MTHAAVTASPVIDTTPTDVTRRLRARSRAIGTLVFTGFGGLWAAGGAMLSSAPAWAWLVIATLDRPRLTPSRRISTSSCAPFHPIRPKAASKSCPSSRRQAWCLLAAPALL